jgi:NAD(P)H-hydrate repair Nnr-like enzyme with NAD(P)H-hydrate dehydratase domain
LTPNVAEYARLLKKVLNIDAALADTDDTETVKKLAAAMGNVTILRKGATDVITDGVRCA